MPKFHNLPFTVDSACTEIRHLRFEARLATLEDRNVTARKLNRKADALALQVRMHLAKAATVTQASA